MVVEDITLNNLNFISQYMVGSK